MLRDRSLNTGVGVGVGVGVGMGVRVGVGVRVQNGRGWATQVFPLRKGAAERL